MYKRCRSNRGIYSKKSKPNPIYKVLGPAVVKSWKEGYYKIKGFDTYGEI